MVRHSIPFFYPLEDQLPHLYPPKRGLEHLSLENLKGLPEGEGKDAHPHTHTTDGSPGRHSVCELNSSGHRALCNHRGLLVSLFCVSLLKINERLRVLDFFFKESPTR